ncbi:MAG TPA: nicotinamide-nucleotide amidohydrolase family protein [Thiobacillaceae bacterium]|nr:nicotinamide-nucleotide amidohydrolase family protein [Thiobacillaceae bacterium]
MRPPDAELFQLSEQLGLLLKQKGWMLASAESCTGGWLGQVVTSVAGSSQWYERGFITYTNLAKQEMLGVSAATLNAHGAVSEETVREMAQGALKNSRAQISVSVSGIAGPGGGTPRKPVGTVCIAWTSIDGNLSSTTCRLGGDREEIRSRAVAAALRGLIELLC